jgi:hypothetical protein
MKIISGMHRSGTSLVARLFFEAGADMGDSTTFYRSDKWNPDGYYEQTDIHAINMPLTLGRLWKFAYFRLPSSETILKRSGRISEQISQTAAKYRGKVVKETRFCLTLPAWLKYGVQVEGVMICIRDPIQVAKSIQRRNKITLRHAYSLWLIHNQRLLEHVRDIPVWFIYYGNLLDKSRFLEEIKPAFHFFGLDTSEEKLRLLGTTIVKSHMNYADGSQANYPEQIESMWNNLLGRHSRQFKTLRTSQLSAVKKEPLCN